MNAVTEMPAPLVFTDNAAHKVRELIEEEGNPAQVLTSPKSVRLAQFLSGSLK